MDPGVKISIIAAVAANGVIGRDGELPWRLTSDLRRFRRLTTGHAVIVGRKTHESILKRLGHPLPERHTIVVTRNSSYEAPGCEVATSFPEALLRAYLHHMLHERSGNPYPSETFVIGGAELYREALPVADRIYLTSVRAEVAGDAWFPPVNRSEWTVEETEICDDEGEYISSFEFLARKPRQIEPHGFQDFDHIREPEQRAVMEEIERLGICPLCPDHIGHWGPRPVLLVGEHWFIGRNSWPYRSTRLHLIFTPKTHAERLADLTPAAWAELLELLRMVEVVCRLSSGAIGIRFGTPSETGATIRHIHAHLIVADQDVSRPGYERVRFPMGPKPAPAQEKKTPDA